MDNYPVIEIIGPDGRRRQLDWEHRQQTDDGLGCSSEKKSPTPTERYPPCKETEVPRYLPPSSGRVMIICPKCKRRFEADAPKKTGGIPKCFKLPKHLPKGVFPEKPPHPGHQVDNQPCPGSGCEVFPR